MNLFLAMTAMAAGLAAGVTTPPAKLLFPSKTGPVTYDHAAHLKRAGGDCKACHDKPWPQSTKVALKSKDCRMCHDAGKAAFEMKGNCKRCHDGYREAAVAGQP